MTALQEKKGIILFGIIAIVLVVSAIVAFQATGPLGIEERFSSAVGNSPGEQKDEGATGVAGFTVEGNALLYLLIIVVLALACVALYRRYRI